MRNWWESFQVWLRVVWPVWFATFMVAGVSRALQTTQGRDMLSHVSSRSFFAVQHVFLIAAALTLAVSGWYFPRALLYVKYWFTPDDESRFHRWRQYLPRVLGVFPMMSVAAAFFCVGEPGYGFFYLVMAGSFFAFTVLRRRLMRPFVDLHKKLPVWTLRAVIVFVVLSVVLLIGFLISRVTLPQWIGPTGVVFLAVAALVAVASSTLFYPTYRFRWPPLALVAVLCAALFGVWNDNHALRAVESGVAATPRPTTELHFVDWLKERGIETGVPREEELYPVFIAAAEGGGIRAAYWTASVLATLEESHPGFACHLFAVSGVSGGSVGASVFSALIADAAESSSYRCASSSEPDAGPLLADAQEILGRDHLGPLLAGLLFPDLLQRFLPLNVLPDRAEYLERSWEDSWQRTRNNERFSESFQSLWSSDKTKYTVPSLFLNATWVENGERTVISNLRPASVLFSELDDTLDTIEHRIALSTAAHVGARFPYVSPPGTVGQDADTRHVVDGGYFENSGAATASELYAVLDQVRRTHSLPIRIIVLIITNDPKHPRITGNGDGESAQFFIETWSPVRTLLATRGARGYHAERRLETLAGKDFVVRAALRDLDDAPLGWMLSHDTQVAMVERVQSLDAIQKALEHLNR